MRSLIAACVMAFSASVSAQDLGMQDPLMQRMVGKWVMTGTIGGEEVNHDVTIDWILQKTYLRIHDLARERDSVGLPAYEAWVHIGWNPDKSQYVCQWLDITGGNGLVDGAFGHATKRGDALPFVWFEGGETGIENTFAYDRKTDTWRWAIDNVNGTEKKPFARVTLTRSD